MNDNEYWVRFWTLVACVVVIVFVLISINHNYSNYLDRVSKVDEVNNLKTLLDSGYTKKVVGCEVQVFDYVKENK